MSRFDDYERYDAIGLAQLIRDREASPSEVLEAAIERTEARNPRINAVVLTCYDAARARAKEPFGDAPLAGVPFLIKDLAYMAGVPCRSGSRLYADVVPDHDSTLIARYRKAGLVLYGKTNTPEFGLTATTEPTLFGPTRNPWNPDYTAGGSSGGAAAAVADGWLPVAHATDGGGSIRIPASCCGLVGLKPTRGRTPLGPDVGEGWGGMSTAHVVSHTVRDTAALLDATHGPAPGDPYHAPAFAGSYLADHVRPSRRLRIALELASMTGAPVHGECKRAAERAAELCEQLGHRVEIASPSLDRSAFGAATGAIVAANIATSVFGRAQALGRPLRDDDVEPYTRFFAERGREVTGDEYVRALRTIHQAGRTLASFHERFDVMLTPTLVGPPVPIGFLDTRTLAPDEYGRRFLTFWGFTNLQNATGQPAISLPLHLNATGLPIGVQFVAPVGDDLLLQQAARELEQAAPWPRRP